MHSLKAGGRTFIILDPGPSISLHVTRIVGMQARAFKGKGSQKARAATDCTIIILVLRLFYKESAP
jgi:hypothetical protein